MKTLKYAFKNEWYNLILLVLPFIAIPFLWGHLPDQVPIHWNIQGEIDGYGNKPFGLLFIPTLNIAIYMLFLYLPLIDPKKRITIDQKPMPVIRTLLVFFLFSVHCWMISIALGNELASSNWVPLGVAILFVVLGNYMRTIQPNYFIGIRVPWTLEDPENWRETHRLASYLWVAGGLLLIVLFPFFGNETYMIIFLTTTGIISLIPVIYSFYIFKQTS
jgi:uncharacterized membrane protein